MNRKMSASKLVITIVVAFWAIVSIACSQGEGYGVKSLPDTGTGTCQLCIASDGE